jgi:hypothetical protein
MQKMPGVPCERLKSCLLAEEKIAIVSH